jgi:tRNA threonylcarbamoyladenosine modification (KEOPS) complex Cgi121 subunit
MIEALRGLTAQSAALAMLFDARSIAGERHLLSAWAHLGRARARGQTRLRDRGAELALFVAGDDQLPRALAKVGISKNTTELVVVAEKPRELSTMLQTFDLIEDPSVYPRPPAEATLERLGILGADRQAVPPSSWESLVLERVALLDLGAPHVPSPTKRKR